MDPETEGAVPDPEAVEGAPKMDGTLPPEDEKPPEEGPDNGTGDDGTDVTADLDDDDDDGEDPIEAAFQERIKLELERERERLDTEVRSKYERERAEESRRAAQLAEQNDLRDSFVGSLRESYQQIKARKFYNEDGDEVTISDEEFQKFVADPMQKHNSVVQQIVQGTVLTQLADTALTSLPDEDARKKFTETATDKPLDTWLKTYAESSAPATKFVKDLEAEVEAKVKAAYARGIAKGQKSPGTTPKQGEERPQNTNNDTSTISGLTAAHLAGSLSDDEFYTQYKKLRGR